MSPRLFVDADDCPVKAEVYRLAQRYGLNVILVSTADIGAPFESWITKVVAGAGNVAGIIANEAGAQDMVVTDNPALAAQVRTKGATALTVRGQHWTPEGPRPILPETKRGSNKARFESVLDDELRTRFKLRV